MRFNLSRIPRTLASNARSDTTAVSSFGKSMLMVTSRLWGTLISIFLGAGRSLSAGKELLFPVIVIVPRARCRSPRQKWPLAFGPTHQTYYPIIGSSTVDAAQEH